VRTEQIETILYTYERRYYSGSSIEEEIYLLTKSGRVMDGIPVARNLLDVAKSQNREPDRWGWWKYDGERYSFAWNMDQSHYLDTELNEIWFRGGVLSQDR
jgi:hypothetical protein